MSSVYLLEALNCKDNILSDVGSKICEIVQSTNKLKNDIRFIIDERSINFEPLMKESTLLKNQSEILMKEMSSVLQHFTCVIKPELNSCSLELETLSKSLHEVNIFLYFLNHLVSIYSLMKQANIKIQSKKFYESANIIKEVQDLLRKDENDLEELNVHKTLSNEAGLSYQHLLNEMKKLWSSYIKLNVEEKNNVKCMIFTVDLSCTSDISDILKAADCLNTDLIEKDFVDLCLKNLMNEIFIKEILVKEEVNDKAVLILEALDVTKELHYNEVFLNLTKVIKFLRKFLNFEIQNGFSFLQKVGTTIGNELAEKIITDGLVKTLPNSTEDLERYNNVVRSTEEFEHKLKECGFLAENSTYLSDYAKNVKVVFTNKLCQSYLQRARVLMKKDLYNTSTSEEIIISKISILPKSYRNILRNKLNIVENRFVFPKSQISKSAEELINLVTEILSEMLRSQELCAVRLLYTIRNVFEMYSAVVPLHHKKFLETLPQQVALFHNNCMYFTHYLVHLTCEYYMKVPTVHDDHFNILLEESVQLRAVATETLEHYVTSQKNQFVSLLLDSGLSTISKEPRLDPKTEKCIRQCLRLLQILKNVWKDVLPDKVCNRAIGFLIDNVIEKIVDLVVAAEDISSEAATSLASVFSIIIHRAPSLFSEQKEVIKCVKNWNRFFELIAVLQGSLRDIEERWCNGMGPLANEFTADEVKHMIRALFQNSERRSALLNKMK